MRTLKRMLYIQAAVTAMAGAALAIAPSFVLETVFGQAPSAETTWARIAGVEAVILAMFMVLVAHRATEIWWWSWAFVFASALVAVIAALHAALGPPPGSSSALWWVLAALNAAFAAGLLWGLGRTGQERPLP